MDSGFRLETRRLVLRPFRPEDLDGIHEVLGDAENMRYYPAPFTLEQSRRWIEWNLGHYHDHGFGLWALESKETGVLLGDCGLTPQTVDGREEVEVGWHVHPRHQRRGLATEAATECSRYAFEELGLSRLISLIRPENLPSRRVAEKLGMEIEKQVVHADLIHHVYRLSST
ncbi:MAG TPA: GNAT family N-acetyltransferase [Actinomycetota bacterium]|nr:GNAT family N-acetyltransferase [Actinomycetota bacterium]